MKVLIIEDNPTIANQLVEFLSAQSWGVDYAHKGAQGLERAVNEVFDVVLLDLNLPDMDGLEVCRRIKEEADVVPGILMLTARDTFEDKAEGFHIGADDYLTKPFDLREVVLRCQALARRESLHQPKTLVIGELSLDLASKSVSRQGHVLKLTTTGFLILKTLMQAHPTPVSRSALLHRIWGDDLPDSDALKSHIYALRNSIDKPFEKALIKTVLNVGFKLDLP